MHPILEKFLDKWVWPTMPGAPGAEFRLHLTKEKCLKGWEISLQRTLGEIEEELGREDEAWKKDRAMRGYAAEGVPARSGTSASTANCTPMSCSAKAGSRTSAS